MKLIQTTNKDYNSMLTFKTYLFEEKETEQAKKDIEIWADIPFYKDESVDFDCSTKDFSFEKQKRLLSMGVSETQLDEIKESEYIIVTCVHD